MPEPAQGPTATAETLDDYYDGVLRELADAEQVGPFTLYLGRPGGWTFHARPRPRPRPRIGEADLERLLRVMRARRVPLALEWTHETAPELVDLVQRNGRLEVEEIPLMLLGNRGEAPAPAGVEVRMLGPGDEEAFAAASAVQRVAFGSPAPDAGTAERDRARQPLSEQARAMLRDGTARVAVAEDPGLGVLAAGRHLPLHGVTEVVGVATLPSARRRGLGSAVTLELVDDAVAGGCGTVFLTAGSPAVARLYAALGFRTIGTGYAARSVGDAT